MSLTLTLFNFLNILFFDIPWGSMEDLQDLENSYDPATEIPEDWEDQGLDAEPYEED
jgi:hypothetical protein